MKGGDPLSDMKSNQSSIMGKKIPQVGGNLGNAPRPSRSNVGGNTPNAPKPGKQTQIGGNYGGPGHKIP